MRRLALALVHHPVLDRAGDVATTAITNLDLHDLSRSARAYAAEALYVVHPLEAQRELASRIQRHWVEGSGGRRIPTRARALGLLRMAPSLADVYADVAGGRGGVEVWTTAARGEGALSTYAEARAALAAEGPPIVLLFGTGWGLAADVLRDADRRIAPITCAPGSDFRHLSVRAACAITLDRLLGVDA